MQTSKETVHTITVSKVAGDIGAIEQLTSVMDIIFPAQTQ
jgi:hypothetical protein